jgi:site-specific DNA-methyltransferase (adenine-specific)
VSVAPFYDDGQVTLFCADFRAVDVAAGSVAAVVTSPPYNVGLDYDGHERGDSLAWPEYWSLAADAAGVMARALVEGGRVWVNTAVSVPADPDPGGPHSGRCGKARVMLAHQWAGVLEAAGLVLVDQVAWCSPRGAGTAWGSWESPAAPNLRGDWESILVACAGGWERRAPVGCEGWRDTVGAWASLCSTVWNLTPARRGGHPAPFPVELARRAIRLSTWPNELVFDPFAGSGSTLLAARQLGRRAIGIERSERYCELAVSRLAQGGLDFQGAA